MVLFLSFIVGAFFGSFLNVLIDRLSTGRSFVKGRSYCEHCKKTLKPQDLVPLISYLYLKGRCRYCKVRIPLRLFLVETICGGTAALLALGTLGTFGVILFCFIGIFVADLVYGLIPDLFVVIIAIASLFYVLILGQSITQHVITGIASLLFFLLLFAITRGRGMGFGDVKLSFALGFLLGFPGIIVSLYLAFLTGAGVSIILVICRKLKFFGSTIPFGPFLVASAVVALFWGQQIFQMFIFRFL